MVAQVPSTQVHSFVLLEYEDSSGKDDVVIYEIDDDVKLKAISFYKEEAPTE